MIIASNILVIVSLFLAIFGMFAYNEFTPSFAFYIEVMAWACALVAWVFRVSMEPPVDEEG